MKAGAKEKKSPVELSHKIYLDAVLGQIVEITIQYSIAIRVKYTVKISDAREFARKMLDDIDLHG